MGRRIDGYSGGEGAEAWEIVESLAPQAFACEKSINLKKAFTTESTEKIF
jgi:hypothetical protein